jgi:hypothetical protein
MTNQPTPSHHTDARGVVINEGDTVIYGAPVGRSIALVEGVADGWTESGRVWVRVIRRAYGHGSRERVHVGADRVVVVLALPDTDRETAADLRARMEVERAGRTRIFNTHDVVEPHWTECRTSYCSVCGVTDRFNLVSRECRGRK